MTAGVKILIGVLLVDENMFSSIAAEGTRVGISAHAAILIGAKHMPLSESLPCENWETPGLLTSQFPTTLRLYTSFML